MPNASPMRVWNLEIIFRTAGYRSSLFDLIFLKLTNFRRVRSEIS